MAQPNPNSADSSRALRDAFGCFTTGVTLITTQTPDGPIGFVANSFSSLSLDPPLIMWAISNQSRRCKFFHNADFFNVHILAFDQKELCDSFAADPLAGENAEFEYDSNGIPYLKSCLARFNCRKYASYPGGDHSILLGEVIQFDRQDGEGLVYSKGGYYKISEPTVN